MSKILEDIRSKTGNGKVDTGALLAELARLAEENAKLKAGRARAVTCKVSEKGALSIYGLGRFPVTLYKSQFDKLAAAWPAVCAFVEANADSFSTKD